MMVCGMNVRTGAPDMRLGADVVYLRTFPLGVRDADGDAGGFAGYGLEWGDVADLGGFTESFSRGAFSHTLDDVRFLVEHGGYALARSPDTMTVTEDDRGLFYVPVLADDSPRAASVASAIRRGDLAASSIAFTLGWGDGDVAYDEGPDGRPHYDIRRVDRLWEISAVNWGAYSSGSIGQRAPERPPVVAERTSVDLVDLRMRLLDV